GIGINGEGLLAGSLMEQTPAAEGGFQSARRSLAQPADGRIAHGLPYLPQRGQFLGRGTERPVVDQAVQRLLLANRDDAAGYALAASLVAEKGGDAQQDPLQIDGVVEQHHDAGPQRRPDGARALERERRV